MATGGAATASRTIVIAGVPEGLLQDEVMADILTIHFQLSRNNGGDVQEVTYPTRNKGIAYVTFEDQEVVESVLKKDQHLLEDKRLSRHYPLTVTRYCDSAFLSVTSLLDVAVFKDLFVLEDLVEEMQKQSPALSFGPLQPDGHIAVQGSFPALQGLREFLLLKAEPLSEKDKPEGGECRGRLRRRRLQERRDVAEMRNSAHVIVLDTDIYCYLKLVLPEVFQASGVVISGVPDGDITTVHIEGAGGGADAAHVLRVKEIIENYSVKLQKVLQKERICFEEHGRGEKQRYQQVCDRLKPHFPGVLIVPYDTHVDVVGTSSDVFEFTEEVKRHSR